MFLDSLLGIPSQIISTTGGLLNNIISIPGQLVGSVGYPFFLGHFWPLFILRDFLPPRSKKAAETASPHTITLESLEI